MKLYVVAGALRFKSQSKNQEILIKDISNPQLKAVIEGFSQSAKSFDIQVFTNPLEDPNVYFVTASASKVTFYATVALSDNTGRSKTSVQLKIGNFSGSDIIDFSGISKEAVTEGFAPDDQSKINSFVKSYISSVKKGIDTAFVKARKNYLGG